MLDVKWVMDHPAEVKKTLKKRGKADLQWMVDELITDYLSWKSLSQQVDALRHRRNALSEDINELKKANKDASGLLQTARELPQKIADIEKEIAILADRINEKLMKLPNMLHPEVPSGTDASHNKVIRTWGKVRKIIFPLRNHVELVESLAIADFDAGRTVAGHGFNYLTGKLALLDLALQRYGIDFLLKKKFTPVVPPLLLNRETLSGAVDLAAFEEVIYKIENENLYLIGTAEHSLVTMMKNRTLEKKEMPLRVCAATPCFRKEVGGHGVDTKGLFRMHQFNKVEQVVFCTPEQSAKMLEEMQRITESFFQSLEIPYRVIEICAGDLGGKFSRQYDIEAWFPRQQGYKEVTSAGSCTDYQARRLNIRFADGEEKRYVHILNNTMVATSRAMVAILENFQQKDGSVKIPEALQKYTGFTTISHEAKNR